MTSFVYLIEAENGVFKIGVAADPTTRLSAVRTHSPLLVRLIAQWPGLYADEQALHARFKDARKHCEWFYPEGEIKDFAESQRGLGVSKIEDWAECLYFNTEKKALHARKIGAAHKNFWKDPVKRRDRLITYAARRIYGKELGEPFGPGFKYDVWETVIVRAAAEYDAIHGDIAKQNGGSA